MSGRDYRNFVTDHRDTSAGLVKRITEGLSSSKYRAVDYEKLKQAAAEKKFQAHLSLAKVNKLEKVSKQHKEQNVLKQHKRAWDGELSRLNAGRRRTTADVDLCLRNGQAEGGVNANFFSDVDDYEGHLEKEFDEFKKNTVDPVWNLRDDLLYWVHQNRADLNNPSDNLRREHSKVLQTVQSVKNQQMKVLSQLQIEQANLEEELKAGELPVLVIAAERPVETGIPEEAFDLECPDLPLKASVLQEFIFIDEKYLEKLEELEEKYADIFSSDTGGWTDDDHFAFLTIVEQYQYDTQNRRTLYMDRLQRHFPRFTRQALVQHEDWCSQNRYYLDRRKALQNDWIRDRHELFNKASVVFAEVCTAAEVAEKKAEYDDTQRELCNVLYEKVRRWRVMKVEVMRLRQETADAKMEEQNRQQEEEKQKEKAHRDQLKKKLGVFKAEQAEVDRRVAEERAKELEQLQAQMAEQAEYDLERLEYRKDQQEYKTRERHKKEEEKRLKEEEKERVLEAIRKQVRPTHVEGDLMRLWSDTEAWYQHTKPRHEGDEVFAEQKPLFEVNTFTANHVNKDPRVRIEARLREAGLIETGYARQVIAQIQPSKPAQQRNMFSTVYDKTGYQDLSQPNT